MIFANNRSMHHDGDWIELATEISCIIRCIYVDLKETDPEAAEKFKGYFLSANPKVWFMDYDDLIDFTINTLEKILKGMEENEKSQKSRILEYLKDHKEGISSLDAIQLFGCTRLAARIADLKADGYVIGSRMVVNKATKTVYSVYYLG